MTKGEEFSIGTIGEFCTGSDTIILITDCTDLDDQLSGMFVKAKSYIGDDTIICVESRDDL